MSLPQAAERRRYPRAIPLSGRPVEVQLMGGDFLDVLEAEDISERGLLIRVNHQFADCDIQGTVALIITLPDQATFKARGIVRHASRAKDRALFGVELTDIDPKYQSKIAKYVDRLIALGRKV